MKQIYSDTVATAGVQTVMGENGEVGYWPLRKIIPFVLNDPDLYTCMHFPKASATRTLVLPKERYEEILREAETGSEMGSEAETSGVVGGVQSHQSGTSSLSDDGLMETDQLLELFDDDEWGADTEQWGSDTHMQQRVRDVQGKCKMLGRVAARNEQVDSMWSVCNQV